VRGTGERSNDTRCSKPLTHTHRCALDTSHKSGLPPLPLRSRCCCGCGGSSPAPAATLAAKRSGSVRISMDAAVAMPHLDVVGNSGTVLARCERDQQVHARVVVHAIIVHDRACRAKKTDGHRARLSSHITHVRPPRPGMLRVANEHATTATGAQTAQPRRSLRAQRRSLGMGRRHVHMACQHTRQPTHPSARQG